MSEIQPPLPVGSVVKVTGSEQEFVIISQLPVTEIDGKQGYFEFGAAMLPMGISSQEMIFFNSEDVDKIIYLGYIDVQFQEFANRYEEILTSIEYERLTIIRASNNDYTSEFFGF
ncbi:MAG: DUF4176 domain-containing protein [Sediminibacterium sp.]|nr:DUF4176 domain-containing protein [Sediminibacterium sp.]